MKYIKLIPLLLAGTSLNLARADFNPVALTPNSYTYAIVVPSNTVTYLPACITASVGGGTGKGDSTFFEQGVYARAGAYQYCGVPPHNAIFTDQSNPNRQYQMPPSYTANNGLLIDSGVTSGTLTLNTTTTCVNIALLDTGGGGGCTVNYTVNHADGVTTETGSFNPGDWFNGSNPAWYCAGRVGTPNGGYDSTATGSTAAAGAVGSNPRMYSTVIAVSSASPVGSISFTYSSGGGHNCFFALSCNASGTTYLPVAVTGFNEALLMPAANPFPITASMDNGTNIGSDAVGGGPGNTWFEMGYDAAAPTVGLPASGTLFNSQAQPTHHYQMPSYSANNAILIDTNHMTANITPANPTNYSAFALLTAGGNIGGNNIMTNLCVLQHKDGVNETNLFFGYDWYNSAVAPAWVANGRVSMNDRTLNTINGGNPKLFESYFTLNDVASPVTNIFLQYVSAPGVNDTTFILAVSASAGGIAPVITSGPLPASQGWYPSQSATFTVLVTGTAPVTNTWLVERGGVYVPLQDGVNANGSTIAGSSTTRLTLSGLTVADATNYEYVAANAVGSVTSSPAILEIKGRAGVVKTGGWNNIANANYPVGNSTNIFSGDGTTSATLTLSDGGVTNAYNSGLTGDGANFSLMHGYMDAGNYGGIDAITTISGLTDAAYDVYLYCFADQTRPSSATDGLPNYAVNGTTYYAPVLGATGASTYDATTNSVGGIGFKGFVQATTFAANDFNQDLSVSSFGNYIKIAGVSAAGGVITIQAEADTSSYRSPLNGIQLISTSSGQDFAIHFLGNTTDPVANGTPAAPVIDSQVPNVSTLSVLTNHTTPFSVTIDVATAPPFFYQWYNGSTPIPNATNASYVYGNASSTTITCIITNFVGAVTSSPVIVTVYAKPTPSAYESAILAYNPMGYWPLQETNGTIAYDYASTNDGIYTGNYTLGQIGLPPSAGIGANTSVAFDGSTAYVNIPVNNLNITGPLTVIAWVQQTSGQANKFETALGHSDASYRLSSSFGQSRFADPGGDVSGPNIDDGNWHQMVGVYDGTHQHLYVDGSPVGTPTTGTPGGSGDNVLIGAAPDYLGARNWNGNIAQVAIIASALNATQVQAVYYSLGFAPSVSVSPASPSVYTASSLTLTAAAQGTAPITYQWYYIDTSSISNNIVGATNSTYTIASVPLTDNGYTFGVNVINPYGTNTASVYLAVQDQAAFLGGDIGPVAGEAYVGAPVTYTVNAQGTLPIYYQWTVNGIAVSGATNTSYTAPAACATNTIQVSFTNAESGGTPIVSSAAMLQGDAHPASITFNTNGTGWQLNTVGAGSVPTIVNNVLELTDGTGGEGSSAFYALAQYVGSFTVSFTYTASGNRAADGVCFIVQNVSTGTNALGGSGGQLGYGGITNSLAFEINLYPNNGETVGVVATTNGLTFGTGGPAYQTPGLVAVNGGNPININLNWANGVLNVSLEDAISLATYSTSYIFGPLTPILGGSDLAYVGFSGGDGGATSIQTISNFEFNSVIPPVALAVSPVKTNSFIISWSAADPSYQLQTSPSLSAPAWSAGPTPSLVGGVNQVTIKVTSGTGSKFYRLVRVVCQ